MTKKIYCNCIKTQIEMPSGYRVEFVRYSYFISMAVYKFNAFSKSWQATKFVCRTF